METQKQKRVKSYLDTQIELVKVEIENRNQSTHRYKNSLIFWTLKQELHELEELQKRLNQ